MKRCVLACALALAAVAAGVARAEGERPLPWEGGANVVTEAETLFGQVASEIAGRPVQVRCNGETDWAQLTAERSLDPESLGYVAFRGLTPGDSMELAPVACWFLDRYAATTPKPAYWCTSTTTVTEWVQKQKRVRERKPLVKKGKPVLRRGKPVYVWTTRVVTTTVPQQRQRTEKVKCQGADEWWKHSDALWTLGHESHHLRGLTDEATVECYGLQEVQRIARRLGATEAEASEVVQQAARSYPLREESSAAYWSPECRSGGALDLTPSDGVWP